MGAQKALLELSKSVQKLNCWILVTLLCIGAAGAWEAAEEEAALALELWWASFSSSSSFTPAAHTVVRPWGVGLPVLIQSDFGHLRIAHWTHKLWHNTHSYSPSPPQVKYSSTHENIFEQLGRFTFTKCILEQKISTFAKVKV